MGVLASNLDLCLLLNISTFRRSQPRARYIMLSIRLSLLFLTVLSQLSFLISANVITARSDYCSNAPSTIAGTYVPPSPLFLYL